jgi:hypothetical protein
MTADTKFGDGSYVLSRDGRSKVDRNSRNIEKCSGRSKC